MKKWDKKEIARFYLGSDKIKHYIFARVTGNDSYFIYKFMYHLRRYEYLISEPNGFFMKIRRVFHLRQYQKYARILGYVIGDGVLGKNVVFYHRASIIINSHAFVGDGCKFHGDAVLGVKNTGSTGCPVLGKNVDIGTGAKILGDIKIADNVVIGANAVVIHSFDTPGVTIAGIPAKQISSKGNRELSDDS